MSRLSFAAVVLLAASVPACAQYSIDKVVFRGGAPYTDTELLSASGLQPGQMLAHDSLAQAAQHLLDTGLFDDAEVSLSGTGNARTVLFALKPTPLAKLLPASFENFVWFTPEELTTAIHAHVPLYRGAFSDAGNFPDVVQSALQQILAEKGVTATISHSIVEPSNNHPVRVVDFLIDKPSVRIAMVHLSLTAPPGAAASLAPGLQQAVARTKGALYNEGLSGITIEELLLLPVLSAGYITARLADVHREVAPTERGIGVTYTARIETGEVYKVANFTWEATPVYSATDFARDQELHSGDLANYTALSKTEFHVLGAYRAQGYLDAYIAALPKLDDATHTVGYAMHVVPGEQYRLKSVTPLNLSPEAQKEFDSGWHMKAGDLYNEHYVQTFINNNTALQHLATYSASFQTSADPQTHLVDLTITFIRGAGSR